MLWPRWCRVSSSRVCGVSIAQAIEVNNCVVLGGFSGGPLEFLQGLLVSSAVPLKSSS